MRQQILQFQKQLPKGIKLAQGIKIDKTTYEKVTVCGMGGSSIAGEILLFWQEITGMPPTFYVHRDYDLPAWVSGNDLVVCISWSGNTEETISSYQAAVKADIPTVSIATGGKLTDLSRQNKTPLILIPVETQPGQGPSPRNKGLKPRMGVGYMTAALFQLIGLGENVGSVSLNAEKTEEAGKKLAEELGEMTPHQTDPLTAKTGAGCSKRDPCIAGSRLVRGKHPLFYSSYKWRIIPHLWKILFNENAKIHAFWNYFPAMAHNELVGFTDKAQDCFFSIFFKDAKDDKRQNKNIDTAIAILNKMNYNYSIIDVSPGHKPLEAILNSYILGLWTSFYLAKKIGVDPENTEIIEEYKRLKGGY